jgi:hypothetical protein
MSSKTTLLTRNGVLLALAVLSFTRMSSGGATTSRVRHTIIAASGGAAPVGGNYITFSFFNATLNARHGIAFDAFLSGPPPTSGVFVREGKTTSAIALGVHPDPAAPSFGTVSNPFLTQNGNVVFDVNFSDVFRSDGKRLSPSCGSGIRCRATAR